MSNSISFKLRSFFSFINCLRVELYYALYLFAYSVNGVPTAQLYTDKICIQKFNQTAEFCTNLAEMDNENDPKYHYKSLVLSESAQYNMYSYIISLGPAVLWSLLFGSWVDKYYYGNKLLLLAGGICMTIESSMLLLQSYWFDMSKYFNNIFIILKYDDLFH